MQACDRPVLCLCTVVVWGLLRLPVTSVYAGVCTCAMHGSCTAVQGNQDVPRQPDICCEVVK